MESGSADSGWAVQEPNWKDTQGTSKPSRNPTAWIRPLTGAMTPQTRSAPARMVVKGRRKIPPSPAF